MKKLFVLLSVIGLLGLSANADGPATPTGYKDGSFVTNLNLSITANATNTLSSSSTNGQNSVLIQPGVGLAFYPTITATNTATTGNAIFNFELSRDNATWSTTHPLTYSVALNGSTTVKGWKSFTAAELLNAKYIRLGSVVNPYTNSTVKVTATGWGYSFTPLAPN